MSKKTFQIGNHSASRCDLERGKELEYRDFLREGQILDDYNLKPR